MSRTAFILFLSFILLQARAQNRLQRLFPKSAVTAQFAGSTGLCTFGFSKVTPHNKLELGILYGRVPKKFGGINNSLVFKITYNPFQLEMTEKLSWEPLQTGLFINQNFNKYSSLGWGENYPPGYYWWTKSTRFHFFLGSQVSFQFDKKHMDRLAWYIEANTNDLYIYSYQANTSSIKLTDIFFLGTGFKLYLR